MVKSRTIVAQGYEKAKEIVQANMTTLHTLANTLLEKEVLDGNQIEAIIKGEVIVYPAKMNLIRCLHITNASEPFTK